MQELRILEVCIGILLIVPLIRSLVKALQGTEGLVLFPLIGLVCTGALFPVYGFRPECLPLLGMAVVLNIHTIPGIIALLKRERQDSFLLFGPVYTVIIVTLMAGSIAIALVFAPVLDTALLTEGVRTETVWNETENTELFLRIYEAPQFDGDRPLILVVPPVIGSVTAVDRVCAGLSVQGFTAISYSRRNFDAPAVGPDGKRYGVSPGTWINLIRAFFWGRNFEGANALGRTFEKKRTEDLLFLLRYIAELDLPGADKNVIFLAGYDFGGAGAAYVGESADALAEFPGLRGLIAVESQFLSLYEEDRRRAPAPPDEAVQWFRNIWNDITQGALDLTPRKMAGIGRVPHPKLPILFLVSDKVLDARHRGAEYRPIIRSLQASPAVVVTVPGSGPLSYSDYPGKYPLYALFSAGKGDSVWKNEEYIEGTAMIITGFASLVLSDSSGLAVKPLGAKIHFEYGELWNLPVFRSILFP